MSPTRHAHRGALVAAITATAVIGASAPAFAAPTSPAEQTPTPSRSSADDSATLSREIRAALRRDLNLSADQVIRQQALQAKAIELDHKLRTSLGEAFAGSSYDAKSGKLIVRVSDASQLAKARAAGAQARLVEHSKDELDAIKDELDAAAGKPASSGPADRQATGQREATVAGMTSWYVDTTTNTVHVTVAKARTKAAARALAKYGDAVTIEPSDLAPVPTDRFMDGGDAIYGSNGGCSAGFNLRNLSTGQSYLLTAGHCGETNTALYGHDGTKFGPLLESWYRRGHDDAIARNDSAGYWIQGSWVDFNPSHGGFVTTYGHTDAPVGTSICKSGNTTKWTCGRITGKDETVNVSGVLVYGLTRHNACVEHGDSGGPAVSATAGYPAEGVTSAAVLKDDTWCLSKVGEENLSWYYPVADSLAYYGPRYGVTLWNP